MRLAPDPRPLVPLFVRALLAVLALACAALPVAAQSNGRISGTVTDKKTGRALAFVNVALTEARLGALSDPNGIFLINNVPAGTYTVRAQFTGYAPQTVAAVVVQVGQTTPLKIGMEEIVVKQEEEVVVKGERPLVDVKQGSTVRTVNREDIKNQGLQTLASVIEQQAGVSNENNLIRVRGGRSDETTFLIDGVANRNPISGESTAGSVNARSVAEVNVIASGFSARYGQALSGIVDVKLKEGSDRFVGGLSAQDGRFFTQFYDGTLSGPDWFTSGLSRLGLRLPGKTSFLLDVSADLSNTYLPNIQDQFARPRLRSGYEDNFLGWRFKYSPDIFMPAEENTWRGLYKWGWKPDPIRKVELSFNKRMQFDQGFNRRSLTDIAGQALTYPWAFHDRLEHYGTVTEDVNTLALAYTQTLSKNAYQTLQLSRFFTGFEYSVDGKRWPDYVAPDDPSLPPGQDRPYFVDSGDDNVWTHYSAENLGIDYRLGANLGHVHKTEFGLQHNFQDVQYTTIINPWEFDPDGLGGDHDLWHVYPAQGALYGQDRLEYEGFVAEGGVRWDYWFPGAQLEKAVADTANKNISQGTREGFARDTAGLFGRRVKAVLSPRLTVSHPIQNRDKFFFNYGQFTQFPSYYYVYSKLTSVSSASFPVLGNANLNPEKSVQYEVGAEHLFAGESMAGTVSFFQKDIYDYPTSVRFQRLEGTNISDFFVYLNSDFSRARGFELQLEKRRSRFWRYKATYEFSTAKGKSSDPNAAKVVEEGGGNATEPPLSEGYLFWNRPHKLTLNVDYRVPKAAKPRVLGVTLPENFGANLFAQVQSGRAYTPQDVNGNATGRNFSKNAPLEVVFNLRLNQEFVFSGKRLNLSLVGENILNDRVVKRVDPNTGRAPTAGEGQYRRPTAYEVNSVLDNPGVYGPPARWRLGIDYDF